MTQYLLDTNVVAFMLRGRQEVLDKLQTVGQAIATYQRSLTRSFFTA